MGGDMRQIRKLREGGILERKKASGYIKEYRKQERNFIQKKKKKQTER